VNDPQEALRPLFIVRCGEDLAGLRRAKDEGDASELGRLAHSLAGSAGTFGFPEITRLARIVEEGFRVGAALPEPALNELIAALDQMNLGQDRSH
jgi:HPt (histidine-containing phosphotransfer) domain-containing protein